MLFFFYMIFWYVGDDILCGVMFYMVLVIVYSLLVLCRLCGGLGFFNVERSWFMLCSLLSDFVFMFSVMWCVVLNKLVSIGMLYFCVLFIGCLKIIVGFLECSRWL